MAATLLIDAGFPSQHNTRAPSASNHHIQVSSIFKSIAATRLPPRRSAVAAPETSVGNMTKLLWLRAQGGEVRIEGTVVEKSRAGERSQITSGRQRLRKPCNRQLMPMTRMGSTRQRGVEVGSRR